MSPANSSTKPIQQVLDLLEGVRPGTDGYTALCPAHGDTRSSLSIGEGDDGRVLLKCFAGCETQEIVDALDLDMADLFPRDGTKPTAKASNSAGLMLQEYAQEKLLPITFLQKYGVGQIYLQGTPAIRMPYMDATGDTLSTRMRLSMTDEPRFVWKTGSKACLYGLWRLKEYTTASMSAWAKANPIARLSGSITSRLSACRERTLGRRNGRRISIASSAST